LINSINQFSDAIILEKVYQKAIELFNNKDINNAEQLFLKIANFRRTQTAKDYYIEQSSFNLGIIYSIKNNPEMSIWYGNNALFKPFGTQYGIQYALKIQNENKIFKNNFNKTTKNLNELQIKKIKKTLLDIHKDIAFEQRENTIELKKLKQSHWQSIQLAINNASIFEIIKDDIEKITFDYHKLLSMSGTVLADAGLLELEFISLLKFDKIEIEKNENYYLQQFHTYINLKLIEMKKTPNYKTIKNTIKNEQFFDVISEKISTQKSTDGELLYALLKNSIFYSQTLLAIVINTLLANLPEKINIHPNILKKAHKNLVLK
jgi:hypothetical protein